MKIFPAIDIRNGKCVRLIKGNYEDEIVFNEDPFEVAKSFEKIGSKYVHIIDLDGAKEGKSNNKNNILKIIKQTNLKIQIGGGIRSFENAETLLNLGVDKIIFGTAALENKNDVIKTIQKFQSRVIVSIDALNGKKIWYFQTVHHDVWDRDLPTPPVLFDYKVNDTIIPSLAQVTKSGYIFLLNRIKK